MAHGCGVQEERWTWFCRSIPMKLLNLNISPNSEGRGTKVFFFELACSLKFK